ncbi:MAG TPA: MoaD/ThiS family protein [Rhizomicrobium sp.]|nr:MoaD/ThiS family protein [Rhizomicrobium sp.]
MKLIFLGRLGAIAPAELEQLDRPAGVRTLSDLRTWLGNEHPILGAALSDQRSLAVVINMTIAHDPGHPIADRDEIAFMPPMSGG